MFTPFYLLLKHFEKLFRHFALFCDATGEDTKNMVAYRGHGGRHTVHVDIRGITETSVNTDSVFISPDIQSHLKDYKM